MEKAMFHGEMSSIEETFLEKHVKNVEKVAEQVLKECNTIIHWVFS